MLTAELHNTCKRCFTGSAPFSHEEITQLNQVTHICKDFFRGCAELTNIDLSALSNITHIGENFLRRCTGLTNVDARTGEKLVAFNKNNTESWNVRKTLLSIRNFAPTSKATKAMQVWNIMRITAKFSAVSQVFDSLAIIEEQRMFQICAKK